MSFGLDSTGFTAKTLADVLSSIRSNQQTKFGAAFAALLDSSVVGQLNGVFANEIADMWLQALAVWQSRYPATAQGISLDYLGQETGAQRLAATKSTGAVTYSGTNGVVIPLGALVSVGTSGAQFATTTTATISSGTATVNVSAVNTGPTLAPAGTLNTVVTPIAGVTSVTNALDVVPGTNTETDANFRVRRAGLLRIAGYGSVAAIRAAVLAVSGVTQVYVFENTTDITDGNGLPPHSFEPVVFGGADQSIRDAILTVKPAGINTNGTTTGTSTDVQGNAQTINFSRPTSVPIYITVTATTTSLYPGAATVKAALVNYWNALTASSQQLGQLVIYNKLFAPIYSVAGITEVTDMRIGTSASPTGVIDIPITARQVAAFDTSRILVNGL